MGGTHQRAMNTVSKVGTVAVGALACVGAFFLHRQIKRQQLFARVAKEHVDLVRDVLYTEDEIRTRAAAMAAEISAYYRDKLEEGETLMVVGLLKGALPFMHELVSHLTIPVLLDYIAVHSYGAGTTSSDEYNFRSDTLLYVAAALAQGGIYCQRYQKQWKPHAEISVF